MNGALGQTLNVVRREQPPGEQGVRSSLLEVANFIKRGCENAKVRAWTLEVLERGRREQGLKCKSDREKAEVLLRAVQNKLWVPDPIGSEFMTGAHLMACDRSTPDELCFMSGDCDDLTLLLGSCFLSAGLHCMVVGHAYNQQRNIEHVLLAVRIRKPGAMGTDPNAYDWLYADPSTDFPLGKCVKPITRERLLSVPNVQVLCDATQCLTSDNWDPIKHDFVAEGVYVGVSGPPTARPSAFEWLGAGGDVATSRPLLAPTFAWLGQAQGQPTAADTVVGNCYETVINSDIESASGRKEAFRKGGQCAADALCTFYSGGAVPPGVCSTIAGPILDFVSGAFSDIFGGEDTIDCSKVSVVGQQCHVCSLIKVCGPFNMSKGPRCSPACAAYLDALDVRQAAVSTVYVANSALFAKYNDLLRDAQQSLVNKGVGSDFTEASAELKKAGWSNLYQQQPQLLDPASPLFNEPATGITIARSLYTIAPAYEKAAGEPLQSKNIPEGEPPPAASTGSRRGGGGGLLLLAVLGIGAGAIWWLTRR